MEISQKAIEALLERCDREDAHSGPSRRFLYTSEIRHLLGVGPGPDYSELEKLVTETTPQKSLDEPADDTGHIDFKCTNPDCYGCMFCEGGLWGCTVCGGLDGGMPSTCPGQSMTADQEKAVYAGTLDYRDGQWAEGVPSRFCPTGWRSEASK